MADEGKAYDNLYLSDLEQKIIDAHRNGAHITVSFYDETDYFDVLALLSEFGGVKRIFDLSNTVAFGNHNYHERWSVKAYIDK